MLVSKGATHHIAAAVKDSGIRESPTGGADHGGTVSARRASNEEVLAASIYGLVVKGRDRVDCGQHVRGGDRWMRAELTICTTGAIDDESCFAMLRGI